MIIKASYVCKAIAVVTGRMGSCHVEPTAGFIFFSVQIAADVSHSVLALCAHNFSPRTRYKRHNFRSAVAETLNIYSCHREGDVLFPFSLRYQAESNETSTLQWSHNGRDGVSNHQPYDCLRNPLFRRRSKKISKLRVTGLREGNSSGTSEFPVQRASNAESDSIWWQHDTFVYLLLQ